MSQVIWTSLPKLEPIRKAVKPGAGLTLRCQNTRKNPEWKRAKERKDEGLPTVSGHLGRGEHMQFTESTLHSHFKQIRGWAGRYHLECPVMGNWVGKGAVHLWLIFTKVFVCVFSQMLTTRRIELNKRTLWIELWYCAHQILPPLCLAYDEYYSLIADWCSWRTYYGG